MLIIMIMCELFLCGEIYSCSRAQTTLHSETKEENCRLDYPALSCNDVSAWTSTVVARERRLGPRRAQQRRCSLGRSLATTVDVHALTLLQDNAG